LKPHTLSINESINISSFLAPAKLNLFLRIVNRRPDGYHELQSVFCLIDLYDELRMEVRTDNQLNRHDWPIATSENNDLCLRAARALQFHTDCQKGADFWLTKKIPVGGGLGGGSSDAATTLLALNTLWDLQLSQSVLMEIGLSLGADVPFFLFGQNAWAEGIGEILTAIEIPNHHYLIVQPQVAITTAEIFPALELTFPRKPTKIQSFFGDVGPNDLQETAAKKFPVVGEVLNKLNALAAAASIENPPVLTGSGSCVFLRGNDASILLQIAEKLPKTWQTFIVRSLTHHPLQQFIPA